MGDPKFLRRKYSKPSHPWRADRIQAENDIVHQFGLKNKREVWKAQALLKNMRGQSRNLSARKRADDPQADKEEEALLKRLIKLGILPEGSTLQQVLTLQIENVLNRRLQTLVYHRGLASSMKHARQLINHGHIYVTEHKMTIPGYLVPKVDEDSIQYNPNSPLTNEEHPTRPQAGPIDIQPDDEPAAQEGE